MFDWFWRLLYNLLKTIFYCIDFVMEFAKKLGGIETVELTHPETNLPNEEVELTSYFLSSEDVFDAFKLVAMIGLTLLFIFTAFAVARASIRSGEGKTPIHTALDGAKALLYLLLVPAIMILGAMFVSAIMTAVFNATSLGGATPGGSIFAVVADEAFKGGGSKHAILDSFRMGKEGFDYYTLSEVRTYFDLTDINYFLGFVGGYVVLMMVVKAMMTFVERIISLVTLFIVAPISVSSSVLDDGARFKLWRDQVINKFLTAYGALIALNIYSLLIGLILRINFFTGGNADFLNRLAQFLFIIGGAGACRQGVVLIGNLVNQGAGSQQAQDDAMTMGTLNKMGLFARGMANRALHKAGHLTAHNPATKSLHNKMSSAVHRRGNANRAARDEIAKHKEIDRIKATDRMRQEKRGLGDALTGLHTDRQGNANHAQATDANAGGGKSLGEALSGVGGGSGSSDSANASGQNTLLNAMHAGAQSGGAVGSALTGDSNKQ